MSIGAKILRAASFAAAKHMDQRRKDARASPYINHPLALAHTLAEEGGVTDATTICTALLHDAVEDTDATLAELRDEFGAEIADVVGEVTDDKRLPKAERKRQQIARAAHAGDRVKLVKLADNISNLRDLVVAAPHGWSEQRKREYFDWSKEVIDQVRGVSPVLEAAFDVAYGARP